MSDSSHFIHGKRASFEGDADLEVRSPFSGELVGTVPKGGAAAVDAALRSASEAFSAWRRVSFAERAQLLGALRARVERGADALSDLLVREVGKPLRSAQLEVQKLLTAFDYFREEGRRQLGDGPVLRGTEETLRIVRDPVGVVAAITPFNFPVMLFSWKLFPAMLAGCTVVAKPDPRTPLSTALLAEWAAEVGWPPGLFNVVHGDGATGAALVEDPRTAKVAFTGSVEAGRAVYESAASGIKRVTLELGGCSPLVVTRDAPFERSMKDLMNRAFYNSGQYCFRINRAYVHRDRVEEFVEAFCRAASELVVGDPADERTDLGPLIDRRSLENVLARIQDAVDAGARVALDGRPHARDGASGGNGSLMGPTVLTEVPGTAQVMQSETFGPVVSISTYDDLDEAIALANGTDYGLAAFGLAGTSEDAERLGAELEAGSVWVNALDRHSMDAPFGGVKQSGIGIEKSRWAFDEYLQPRAVYVGEAK